MLPARNFILIMHRFFIKTPGIARLFFPGYLWKVPTKEKDVFLTFDDGPHPVITPWVLQQLQQFGAKGTFFCIGDNVRKHPDVYARVIDEGHSTGNHTYHHLNGWETETERYIEDIKKAKEQIDTNLFRPPYGKIRANQAKQVPRALETDRAKIVMWDVLSADFDGNISKERCLQNVLRNFERGSIIVFHDSDKAFPHLEFVLPRVLAHLSEKGFICRKIECINKSP